MISTSDWQASRERRNATPTAYDAYMERVKASFPWAKPGESADVTPVHHFESMYAWRGAAGSETEINNGE